MLQQIHDDIRGTQPWKITVAEDLQNNEWITRDPSLAAFLAARQDVVGYRPAGEGAPLHFKAAAVTKQPA